MILKRVWVLAAGGMILLLAASAAWRYSIIRPKELSICAIQGNAETSAHLGEEIITQGLLLETQRMYDPAGVFLIDPDCNTPEGASQGIFVELLDSADLYHRGDLIQLRGTVLEVEGETRIRTVGERVKTVSLGNALPNPVDLAAEIQHRQGLFSYENWEGMAVFVSRGEAIGSLLDGGTPRILPGLRPSSSSELICFQREGLILGLGGLETGRVDGTLRPGDRIGKITGVLRQRTGGYWIQLTAGVDLDLQESSPAVWVEMGVPTATLEEVIQLPDPGTGTPEPGNTATAAPVETLQPTPTWYPVNLLITELLPNPESKEPQGEWIEIYNPEPYGLPLTGIKVGDETMPSGKEGMLRFPDGYYIEANEVLVIARDAEDFRKRYGFFPDFEFADSIKSVPDLLPYENWGRSAIQFSNSGDEGVLLDPWDQLVDLVVYGDGEGIGFSNPPNAPAEGISLERYPPERDRDRGGDWRERDAHSPGRLDRSPPTQAASPSTVSSPTPPGADIPTETLNPSPTPSITPSATRHSTAGPLPTSTMTTPTQTPPAGQKSETPFLPSLTETDCSTRTAIPSQTMFPAATSEYSITPSATTLPASSETPTFTWTMDPPPTNFPERTATETLQVTYAPTPTPVLTPTLFTAPHLILNEIHADPDPENGDANGDGEISSNDDEFVELVNTGNAALDLAGWQVRDSLRVRFTFPEGAVLDSGCGLVLFGGGEPIGDFGGSGVYLATSLALNNNGDRISLLDSQGVEQLTYDYGLEGGRDQSLVLHPDLIGELPLVPHSEILEASGRLYSPGTRLDGSPFPDCQ